jgi:hypothetical protein
MDNSKNTMAMMITLRGTNEVCHNIRNLLTNRRAYFYIETHPRVPQISGQVSGGFQKDAICDINGKILGGGFMMQEKVREEDRDDPVW